MRSTRVFFFIAAISCINTFSAGCQSVLKADNMAIAYLEKFRSDYITSMLKNKPASLQLYYADSLRLMTEFQKTVLGKRNALLYKEAFSKRFDIKSYSRTKVEILDLGSRVVEHGTFEMTIQSRSTNKIHALKGKYQNLWKKVNDTLELFTEAWNYNHPLTIAEQLRFDNVPTVDVALGAHLPINTPIRFELAALSRLMEATIAQHDAKIWSQFYADKGILFSQSHSLCENRKAIDAYIEMHVNELPVFEKLDIRSDRIDDLGEYVIEYASHIANWRSGEVSGIGLGKDLRIWQRQKNGSLKIFRHISMYD